MKVMNQTKAGYHHGDLRNALVEAGVRAAEAGGPDSIVLGHVAKEVGVSAAAAYRHFPEGHQDLVNAIAMHGFEQMARYMNEHLAEVQNSRDPKKLAMRRFRAVGRGYVTYALKHPGLFATSCSSPSSTPRFEPDRDAFGLLSMSLDELEAAGLLTKRNRTMADLSSWSAVHGLAVLLTTGPLGGLSDDEQSALIERTLDMVGTGLTGVTNFS